MLYAQGNLTARGPKTKLQMLAEGFLQRGKKKGKKTCTLDLRDTNNMTKTLSNHSREYHLTAGRIVSHLGCTTSTDVYRHNHHIAFKNLF